MSTNEPSTEHGPRASERSAHWLDRPSTHKRIAVVLALSCAALVIVDFFYEQHGHFDYETWNGFHALFGFFAYVAIVQTAKILREFVQQSEDYYGE